MARERIMRKGIHQTGKVAVFSFLAMALGHIAAQTQNQPQIGPHFIHGSWVNVREAADAGTRATDQLVTNTPVNEENRGQIQITTIQNGI